MKNSGDFRPAFLIWAVLVAVFAGLILWDAANSIVLGMVLLAYFFVVRLMGGTGSLVKEWQLSGEEQCSPTYPDQSARSRAA